MKKAILGILILLTTTTVTAHGGGHSGLPEPGTTPDSIFYGFDTAMDGLSLALTFNDQAKAEKRISIGRERLAEARTMALKSDNESASVAAKNFQKNMDAARKISQGLDQNSSEEVSGKINQTYRENKEVLKGLIEVVPEEASTGIRTALERSTRIGMRQLPVGRPDSSGFISSGRIESR